MDTQQRLFPAPAVIEDMYRNTALDMLASSVLQQIRNTAQIQVIKGESGLGKTTFCRRLLLEAGGDLSITLVTADRKTGISEILHIIAGGKEDDTRAPLQVLAKNAAQRIYQQLYNELQPVVLIDDAHCLSAQTLANLFRFQHAIEQQKTGGLKLVLVGERRIDSRIESVDKKVIARDRFLSALLRPLTRNEIDDFIGFKFERAHGAKPKLNKQQLQYVRKNSGGIPARVEQLCLRALQGRTFDGRRMFAILCVIALIAGGLGYHFRGLLFPERQPAPAASSQKKAPARTGQQAASPGRTAPEPEPSPPLAAEPAPVAIPDTDPAPAEEEAPPSLAWLSNQPAEYYLIQVVGGRDPVKMENFRRSLDLPHPLTLHKTLRNGQDWYLLFYGPFPDYESAVEARAELPADIRKNQPWIRQIGSILEKQ